jgi:hypothetical protein
MMNRERLAKTFMESVKLDDMVAAVELLLEILKLHAKGEMS